MHTRFAISKRRGRWRSGAAAVELALVVPILAMLLVIAVDFCRLFYHYTTITNCARNGALYLADPTVSAESHNGSLEAAVRADAPDLTPQPTVASPVYGNDGNGDAYVEVTVSYTFSMVTTYLGFGEVTLSRTVRARMAPLAPG